VRRHRTSAAVFAGYLALAFAYFGVRVAAHPERTHVGGLFTDPQIFVWSFAWWPHALLHGENPFYTHAIWAPDGFNLAWATSVPGLAVAFAPLTLAFGPVLAYDAACVVMPALAAWAAYLLCRELTGRTWPSLAGGYLFGFSSYVLGGELTHLHTVAVFPAPLLALAVLRFVRGGLSGLGLAVRAGVLLALEAYCSTELLFTLTAALAAALVQALALVPAARRRLVASLAPLAGAYALAALLAAPLLYYVATGYVSGLTQDAPSFSADLLNLVVPTRASLGGWWSDGVAGRFPANDVERGAYLGVPALAIVLSFGLRARRSPGARFLLAGLALAVLAALGSWVTVDGRRVATLPWSRLATLPLWKDVMPVRFMLYASLALAVAVALWAASDLRPAWVRPALAALAVVFVAPDVSWHAWARRPDVPSLFTTGEYRSCLSRGENVLAFPVGARGDSLVWQAEAGFWFRFAGGYVSQRVPDGFLHPKGVARVATSDNPFEVTLRDVLALARRKGVTAAVVSARASDPWRSVLAPLGPPERAGGALVYRLPGAGARRCGASG